MAHSGRRRNANRYGLAPGDPRAVQRVAGPQLVRPGRLEPAEAPAAAPVRRRRSAPAARTCRCSVRSDGAQPGRGLQDPLRPARRSGRASPASAPAASSSTCRGGAAAVTCRGGGTSAVEPARPARPGSTGRSSARDTVTGSPTGPGVRPAGQLADQPAPLPGRQRRIGGLLDQRVPEQRHLLGPRRPRLRSSSALDISCPPR